MHIRSHAVPCWQIIIIVRPTEARGEGGTGARVDVKHRSLFHFAKGSPSPTFGT